MDSVQLRLQTTVSSPAAEPFLHAPRQVRATQNCSSAEPVCDEAKAEPQHGSKALANESYSQTWEERAGESAVASWGRRCCSCGPEATLHWLLFEAEQEAWQQLAVVPARLPVAEWSESRVKTVPRPFARPFELLAKSPELERVV